jgi:signal transduction histidine kinase
MFRSSIDTLLSMVNNIVHTSIIDADRMNYALEDFTLSVLLRELSLTFEATAMLGGITLDFSCPQDICVRADREKIHMVFYNLLSNAFRYTPYGGSIAIKALPEGDTVTIIVSDTGQGIAESEYDKVFQKFSRVKGELRGTGMGLYIVRNILKGHGSDIRFESAMGKGTKFFFSLAQGTPPGNDAPPL